MASSVLLYFGIRLIILLLGGLWRILLFIILFLLVILSIELYNFLSVTLNSLAEVLVRVRVSVPAGGERTRLEISCLILKCHHFDFTEVQFHPHTLVKRFTF